MATPFATVDVKEGQFTFVQRRDESVYWRFRHRKTDGSLENKMTGDTPKRFRRALGLYGKVRKKRK